MPSFNGAIKNMCSGMAEKEKKEKFTSIDRDESGMLDKEELFFALQAFGKSNEYLLEFNEKMPSDKQLCYLGFKSLAISKEAKWHTAPISKEAAKRLSDEVDSINIFNTWVDKGRKE